MSKNNSGLRKKSPWLAGLLCLSMGFAGTAMANHSVIVEGQSDFDGDGLLGVDEDSDGDRVFGTINGALQVGIPGAVNQNGRVTIVTSGQFLEQVVITAGGNVVLEAAPGVNAVIEAFAPGDADNNTRQQQPGIIVNSNGDFVVEIRNIISRNWTVGILAMGDSRVNIDDVRVDSNVNYGIQVVDNASVDIVDSQVTSSGFRRSGTLGLTPGGDIAPAPGIGIAFEGSSSGFVANTTVSHSFAAGISNESGDVELLNNVVFNNDPDLHGFRDNGRRGNDDGGR